jgi:hypothetical protein
MLPKILRIFGKSIVAWEHCQHKGGKGTRYAKNITIMSLRDFGQCDSLPSRAIIMHFVLKIDFDNFHLSCLPEIFKMCLVLVLYSVYGNKMGVSLAQKVFLVVSKTSLFSISQHMASFACAELSVLNPLFCTFKT